MPKIGACGDVGGEQRGAENKATDDGDAEWTQDEGLPGRR